MIVGPAARINEIQQYFSDPDIQFQAEMTDLTWIDENDLNRLETYFELERYSIEFNDGTYFPKKGRRNNHVWHNEKRNLAKRYLNFQRALKQNFGWTTLSLEIFSWQYLGNIEKAFDLLDSAKRLTKKSIVLKAARYSFLEQLTNQDHVWQQIKNEDWNDQVYITTYMALDPTIGKRNRRFWRRACQKIGGHSCPLQ